jgi:hypothetical protein
MTLLQLLGLRHRRDTAQSAWHCMQVRENVHPPGWCSFPDDGCCVQHGVGLPRRTRPCWSRWRRGLAPDSSASRRAICCCAWTTTAPPTPLTSPPTARPTRLQSTLQANAPTALSSSLLFVSPPSRTSSSAVSRVKLSTCSSHCEFCTTRATFWQRRCVATNTRSISTRPR